MEFFRSWFGRLLFGPYFIFGSDPFVYRFVFACVFSCLFLGLIKANVVATLLDYFIPVVHRLINGKTAVLMRFSACFSVCPVQPSWVLRIDLRCSYLHYLFEISMWERALLVSVSSIQKNYANFLPIGRRPPQGQNPKRNMLVLCPLVAGHLKGKSQKEIFFSLWFASIFHVLALCSFRSWSGHTFLTSCDLDLICFGPNLTSLICFAQDLFCLRSVCQWFCFA